MVDEVRRVLIISYNYPPVGNVGAVRTTKLARYLPALGWSPTILTVSRDRTKWGGGDASEGVIEGVEVIHAPFPDVVTAVNLALRRIGVLGVPSRPDEPGSSGSLDSEGLTARLFSCAKRWAAFPDRYLLWIPFAAARALVELRRRRYGVIYSTSPPVSDHAVAALVHRLTGVPWVADLRDPWRHPYLEFSPLQDRLNARLARLVLKRSSAVITVSGPLAEAMEREYGARRCGVRCITNGYDPADYSEPVEPVRDRFVITYTGALFGLKQDPSPLLEVLDGLASDRRIDPDRVLVRFYGPREPALADVAAGLRHPGMVEIAGVVPRAEALRAQRESAVLLVLLWDDPGVSVGYGAKVLEYLGARRPVLAWNPSGGVIGELLERTGAGVAVRDREALRGAVLAMYEEFDRTGTVAFRGREPEINRFSWVELSGEMSSVLDCAASRAGR